MEKFKKTNTDRRSGTMNLELRIFGGELILFFV